VETERLFDTRPPSRQKTVNDGKTAARVGHYYIF
jgi:hypothetical protein